MGEVQAGQGEERRCVIYALTTMRGRVRYVGETSNLRERIASHKQRMFWPFRVLVLQDAFVEERPEHAEIRWIRHYSQRGYDLLNRVCVRKPPPKTRRVVRWVLCGQPGREPAKWNILKVEVGQSIRESLLAHDCIPAETTIHGAYWSRCEGFQDKKLAMKKHDPDGFQYK